MRYNYKDLLAQKASIPDMIFIHQDIESADTWEDAYWIGKYLFEQASGKADKLIMVAYERAFDLGLNIRTNRKLFLTATQDIARIYFQFRKYEEAVNKLMVLDSHIDDLPDWVNLYYVSAQIHTESILYWAECPEFLFNRIDVIDEADSESIKRRKYLFLEFLNRLSELSKTEDLSKVDKDAILGKAAELGIADSEECLAFKDALGIIPATPELPDEHSPAGDGISVNEQMETELTRRLSELQSIVYNQEHIISLHEEKTKGLQHQITELQAEKEALEKSTYRQEEALKTVKEHEYALQARCHALESQLSGSEATRKQLEDDASLIGELRTDVEDLKTALTVSRKHNDNLQTEVSQYKEIIDGLKEELLKIKEENRRLHVTIESQKAQIEVAKAVVKSNEEGSTDSLLPRESGETTGRPTTPDTGDIYYVDNYLPRRQKILIIGGSETKENHLRGKLKSMGFTFTKDQLEFQLEYSDIKDYTSRILPWSGKYAGIIVGPCPHKAKDTDGYSSFIEMLKTEEGYPHVEEAREKSGKLKISNSSLGAAMMKMVVYLQSIA